SRWTNGMEMCCGRVSCHRLARAAMTARPTPHRWWRRWKAYGSISKYLGRGVVGGAAGSGQFLWGYNRAVDGFANVDKPVVSGDPGLRVHQLQRRQCGAADSPRGRLVQGG